MKPRSSKQSQLRRRFRAPHDVWYNGTEGRRIARRAWKRHHAKLGRHLDAKAIAEQTRDHGTGQ